MSVFVATHKLAAQPPAPVGFQQFGVENVTTAAPTEIPALQVETPAVVVVASPVPSPTASPVEESHSPKQPNKPVGFNYLSSLPKKGEGNTEAAQDTDITKVELRKTVRKERPESIAITNPEQSDFRGTLKRGFNLAQAAQMVGDMEKSPETPTPVLLTKPKPLVQSPSSGFATPAPKVIASNEYAVPLVNEKPEDSIPTPPIRSSVNKLDTVTSPLDSGDTPETPDMDKEANSPVDEPIATTEQEDNAKETQAPKEDLEEKHTDKEAEAV